MLLTLNNKGEARLFKVMVTLLGQQNIPRLAWCATNWTQISILQQMGASNCYHKLCRRHYITAILQVTL